MVPVTSSQGRLAVVLPESVFDTKENKYIRLFLYRHFNLKAIVSLPQLAFAPYTSTKTSLLFATKKTKEEIEAYDAAWRKYEEEYSKLRKAESVKFVIENHKLMYSGDCLTKLLCDLNLAITLKSNILDKQLFTEDLKDLIMTSKAACNDRKWLEKDKNGKDKIDLLLEKIERFVGADKLNKIDKVDEEVNI